MRAAPLLPGAAFALHLLAAPAAAEWAVVKRVLDGDTLDVSHEGRRERVRLRGF